MLVRLRAGHPYWMLLDPASGKLKHHLSYLSPGPIEIPEETLNPFERQALSAALKYRILEEVKDRPQPILKAPPEEDVDVAHLLEDDPEYQARRLLQLNVSKCQDALAKLVEGHQLAVLEAMRTLEEQGQNHNGAPRKTVLAALDKAIEACSGVTQVVDSEPEEVQIIVDVPEKGDPAAV